ncbi:MAG: acetate kinase, partial [Deltaproteobacteria bacterium]
TTQNGDDVPGTFMNVATLFLGMSYSLSKKTYLNVNVGIGLTVDAPDVQVSVSIPIRLL